MSWREHLLRGFALQQWAHLPTPTAGPYSPGYFGKYAWPEKIAWPARRAVRRLLLAQECRACGAPISPDTEGDHCWPRSVWGDDPILELADNWVPLCGRHNSSKGSRDLIAWWRASGFPPAGLVPGLLSVDSRSGWRILGALELLDEPADPAAAAGLADYEDEFLPTPAHVDALRLVCARQAREAG